MNRDNPFPIENSTLYKRLMLEKRAIEEHKWYLSEKAGYDVGFEYAQYNWVMAGHRKNWLDKYFTENSTY